MPLVYSSGIVLFRERDGVEYLLLQSGQHFDFPKGRIEPGETPEEAAKRETKEESGLSDLDFLYGMVNKDTKPYKTKVNGKSAKKIAKYYLAKVLSGKVVLLPNEQTGKVEHNGFRWVSYEQAKKMNLSLRISEVLDWARDIIGKENVSSL